MTTYRPPRTEALLADLQKLIQAGGYSQSEVARALGTTRQKVNSWFRPNNPHAPGLEDGLAIVDLLRRETRKAKRRAKHGHNVKQSRNYKVAKAATASAARRTGGTPPKRRVAARTGAP